MSESTTQAKAKRPQQARGLPAGFGLGAPLARRPVQIGDYLDDAPPAPVPVEAPEVEAAEPPDSEQPATPAEPAEQPTPRKPKRRGGGGGGPAALPEAARSRFVRRGPPRKQINMRPETLDRARELLWLVQEYGPQPDAKASEMFEALVDLLYEARGRLDLSDVPLRGKWGDPSAREFPQHLKRAFVDAILQQSDAGEGAESVSRKAA